MDELQDSMMEIFAFETNQFLESLEKILMESEQQGSLQASVQEIFRIMHTIKSSSAMMSMEGISRLAHTVEDLFYYIRENKPTAVDEKKLTDIVLDAVDFIKRNMDGKQSEDPAKQIAAVNAYLALLKSGGAEQETPAVPAEPEIKQDEYPYTFTVFFKEGTQMLAMRALEVQMKLQRIVRRLRTVPADVSEQDEETLRKDGFILCVDAEQAADELLAGIQKSPFVLRAEEKQELAQPQAAAPAEKPEGENAFVERRRDRDMNGFVSVAIAKLDQLVDLAGEITVAEMVLANHFRSGDTEQTEKAIDSMRKLIHEIQQLALASRMVPLTDTFHKLNRLQRDVSRKLGKEIQFVTNGAETEVDKSMIDLLFSPLMHILRNSVDHGIESAKERLAAGKPEQGTVTLSAATEGRNVLLTVTDDGRGFDREKILLKAFSMGLITQEQGDTLSDEEVNALVFMPGFSTNTEVTEFSGRGVGMDVVNENMKKMAGKILAESVQGKGTKITLTIPLTLALIEAVVLRVGTQRCVVPVSAMTEIINGEEAGELRCINGVETLLLRGACCRVVRLSDVYGQPRRDAFEGGIFILVQSERERYVLFADAVEDRLHVVVKPVPPLLSGVRGISGCTILGDGKISLILDTNALVRNRIEEAAHGKPGTER